ncbi:hypothetical protein [Georgenia muralis]|uniref:Uncharacterized protein n=1 Tax=Georgenia muralis TaxID=154117 RepID=A0A3N4ZS15_9MICO|nr:hypothetical protein [Georgenia muralis]RPF28298.1 hypothetical protein EDD32_2821 [Georgenia muralis]
MIADAMSAALAITAAGVVISVGVASRAGLHQATPVLLDFMLAAGLLLLSSGPDWDVIAAVALVVAIRHLATAGLSVGTPPARWHDTLRCPRQGSVDRLAHE